ncbi:hypothetical protein KJ564_10195 [bacterium]|nr:hypothetical protein [bacterium]
MVSQNPFLYLVLISAGFSVFIYIRMVIFLQKQDVKFQLFKFRLMLPYINRYKELYTAEGSVGVNLFTYWLICINGTLLFAVMLIISVW